MQRYVLYALGEILLVVLGILIALQINNWNQSRIDASKEKVYLVNLRKEITANLSFNQALILDRLDAKIEGLQLAKDISENGFQVVDTLEALNKISYGGVFSGGFSLGVRNYYDELLSTGNLQLIKNDSLKNVVANYYTRIEYYANRVKSRASQYANIIDGLRPFMQENPSYISKYDQMEMIEAFKTDDFSRMVDAELSYADAISDFVNALSIRAEKISALIDKELEH